MSVHITQHAHTTYTTNIHQTTVVLRGSIVMHYATVCVASLSSTNDARIILISTGTSHLIRGKVEFLLQFLNLARATLILSSIFLDKLIQLIILIVSYEVRTISII